MGKTSIEWTDCVWNPVVGCSRKSEGCRNCWSERFLARFGGIKGHKFEGLSKFTPHGPRWSGIVRFAEDALDEPLHFRKPRKIFVCSTSDLFHEQVPDEWIDRVFATMALTPRHTFQCLTKRPERMLRYFAQGNAIFGRINNAARAITGDDSIAVLPTQQHGMVEGTWPLPNVWLGVSVEDQSTANERIPMLLSVPAAIRWISYEPALDPVEFCSCEHREQTVVRISCGLHGLRLLHWIIVGGESGPGARPFDIEWARHTIRRCRQAGVACFVKQLGRRPNTPTRLRSPKGGSIEEWPVDLQVREFPKTSDMILT